MELVLVRDLDGTRLMWGGMVLATEPEDISRHIFAWRHFTQGHRYTISPGIEIICSCGETFPPGARSEDGGDQ